MSRMLSKGGRVWLLGFCILIFWKLALGSLVGDSPTMDEQNHLARGIAFLGSGDPRLSVEHPPLINSLLASLPYLLLDLKIPYEHPSWNQPEGWYAFAEQLLWVVNHDVARMIFLGRLPIVWLYLLAAVGLYRLGNRFWGGMGGVWVFIFFLFDPNLIAHGRYSTTDMGGTIFILGSVGALWYLWQEEAWRWERWFFAVLMIGAAFGSKLSAVGFIPIFILLALLPLYEWGSDWRGSGRRLWQLGTIGVASLVVVWGIFGFQWGEIQLLNEQFSWINGYQGPMPTFWTGVDQILSLSSGGRSTFLLGKFSNEGFAWYFPIAFVAKSPILLLIGLPVGLFYLLKERQSRKRALYLLVPISSYFLLSLQSSLNIGYRHLLPMIPFCYLLLAGWLAQWKGGWQKWGAVAFMGLFLGTNLLIYPHYLSYFNPIFGGPTNGYNVLIDSNIDWGQDLLRLQDWLEERGNPEIKLAWFGTADPAYYGINYEPLPGLPRHFNLWWDLPFNPEQPEPGIYIISASNLWELPLAEKHVFAWFRAREPDDRVGYSLLIYEVR